MAISIFAQHINGIYSPYGYGRVGQSFSFGNLSVKYTQANRAKVTSSGQVQLAGLEQKLIDTFKANTSVSGNSFATQISKNFSFAPGFVDRGSSEIIDPVAYLARNSINMRMSTMLQSSRSNDLELRNGTASVFNGLTLHNDEIYTRHIREDSTTQAIYDNATIIKADTLPVGQLTLPKQAQGIKSEELNIRYLTSEEKIALAEAEYNRTHYSMEESFLRDLYSGTIEQTLSMLADATDIYKSTESFCMNAARYKELITYFFADDENIETYQNKLNEVINKSQTAISAKAAGSLDEFFKSNGTTFDAKGMADTISELLTQRTAQYASAYSGREISVEHTDISVYKHMDSSNHFTSAQSAQFGSLSYNDIARLSDAIYEFENALISQIDNLRCGGEIAKEHVGMVLGMASAQARLMDDGSALFSAFRKAADNKINSTLNQMVADSEKRASEFHSEGYGLILRAFSRSDVLKVMSWFDGVENGDTEKNLLLAMEKVMSSYRNGAQNDSAYAGAFSPNNKHLASMPSSFWMDMQAYSKAVRNETAIAASDYMLLNWNIWAKTSTVVQDSANYLIGATGSVVNTMV